MSTLRLRVEKKVADKTEFKRDRSINITSNYTLKTTINKGQGFVTCLALFLKVSKLHSKGILVSTLKT